MHVIHFPRQGREGFAGRGRSNHKLSKRSAQLLYSANGHQPLSVVKTCCNLPYTNKDSPENTSPNFLGDVVHFGLARAIIVGAGGAPGIGHAAEIGITLGIGFVETQGAYDCQALGHVEPQRSPLEHIGSGQAQEVACARIIDIQRRAIEIARAARACANVPTLVDEGQMVWVFAARL